MDAIVSPDLWTLDDKLGFAKYVEPLAKVALIADTPLTIGIFGSWGTGKTSLMHMLEKRVGNDLKTLWFDAWKYSKEETLWRSLLGRVLESIRQEGIIAGNNSLEKEISLLEESLYRDIDTQSDGDVSIDLGEIMKSLSMASVRLSLSLVPGWGVLSELVKTAQKDSASAVDGIFNAIKRQKISIHKNHIQFLDQFQKTFSFLIEEYFVKRSRRLVIIIDDLDRCVPEKAVEVLEAIKLFLDVPGCVFILGVDRDVIVEGIRKFHKFPSYSKESKYRDDLAVISGSNYLEKIIQLPFFLPPLEKGNVKKYINHLLSGMEYSSIIEVFLAGVEPNPRKIKRTINTFLFLEALSRTEQGQDIDNELLAKMVAIQQRFGETVYRDLIEYPSLLFDLEKYFEEVNQKENIRSITLSTMVTDGMTQNKETQRDERRSPQSRDKTLLEKYASNKNLKMLLLSGKKRFRDYSVEPYIYLTKAISFTPNSTVDISVDDKIWYDLFSNDITRIRHACDLIEKPEVAAHIDSLLEVLTNPQKDLAFRSSVGIAIGYLGDPRLSRTVKIPEGEFQMGSTSDIIQALAIKQSSNLIDKLSWETERHTVYLEEFEMDLYPVTNQQYKEFVDKTGRIPPLFWKDIDYPEGTANHPVVGISWHDAMEYAHWVGKRLPTEAEWEKAARGTDAREWPWGNEFNTKYCNTNDAKMNTTVSVGIFPLNSSPYGLLDMTGNVWEWTSSLYARYPYNEDDGRENLESEGPRVLRGGSFFNDAINGRCAFRNAVLADVKNEFIGFRCCK